MNSDWYLLLIRNGIGSKALVYFGGLGGGKGNNGVISVEILSSTKVVIPNSQD